MVLPDAAVPGRVDLRELMRELAKREVNEVHVEAGPRLSGALLAAGLIDEMLSTMPPAFWCGDGASGCAASGRTGCGIPLAPSVA